MSQDDHHVHVQASNGFTEVWSKDLIIILEMPDKELPPYFGKGLHEEIITLTTLNETFVYKFPAITDS